MLQGRGLVLFFLSFGYYYESKRLLTSSMSQAQTQLLDNHKFFDGADNKSVSGYLHKYVNSGRLNIVSGYVSATALAWLLEVLNDRITEYRFVIGEYSDTDLDRVKGFNILNDGLDIGTALTLPIIAKEAVRFLEQSHVEVKTLQPNFCHAKLYVVDKLADELKERAFFIVGSANLTGPGIGTSSKPNLELSLASDSTLHKHAIKWFEELWSRPEAKEKIKTKEGKQQYFKAYLIEQISKLFYNYTPWQIYYKILFEMEYPKLLEQSLDVSVQRDIKHLERTVIWSKLYPFQRQGVLSLLRIMQTYGGAILADAVGLGKTFSALAVMKFYQEKGYTVILCCPKKLENNWLRYLYDKGSFLDADDMRYIVCYHSDLQDGRYRQREDGRLGNIISNPGKNKVLLVVDESHNLRNDKSKRYQTLVDEIIKVKEEVKVLLLSATPINTQLKDVRNQIKLVARGNNDEFGKLDEATGEPLYPNLYQHHKNLEHTFINAQNAFNEWTAIRTPKTIGDLIRGLGQNFFALTDALIVARTRKMITDHLREGGISEGPDLGFPTKNKPDNAFVESPSIGRFSNVQDLVDAMTFKLVAYRPADYLPKKEKQSVLKDEQQRQHFLVKMMFVLLAKRLESSWHAFDITLNRITVHHQNALNKVNQYLSGQADTEIDGIDDSNVADIQDELDDDQDTANGSGTNESYKELTLGKKNPIRLAKIAEANELDRFKADLEKDLEILNDIRSQLAVLRNKIETEPNTDQSADPKLENLIDRLRAKQKADNKKVIIFTSFGDTALYLYEQLEKRGFERLGLVTGQEIKPDIDRKESHRNFEPVLERFAPYTKLFKERDWQPLYDQHNGGGTIGDFAAWKEFMGKINHWVNDTLAKPIDILIATDCLSEGQNLQDADMVINYDIHWNPVRLVQRMGRIDRLGSPNQSVTGVNYWPSANLDEYLNLRRRVEDRMALMLVAGAETVDTTEYLAQLKHDNPLLSEQQKRFYEQMMQTWEGIDTPADALGLNNLSMEIFRQELLEELSRHKNEYEQMPLGVFSGIRLDPAALEKIAVPMPAPGLVALLGYPRRPEGVSKHEYKDFYLMAGADDKTCHKLTHIDLLQLLRAHKGTNIQADRVVSQALERADIETTKCYQNWISDWATNNRQQVQKQSVENLFLPTAGKKQVEKMADATDSTDINNLDLIAWMEVNGPETDS